MSDQEQIVADYRNLLTKTEQESQAAYDKATLTLSGGALGLSFAFVKDFIGSDPMALSWALLLAWISWALSATSILTSFYLSQQALREAIRQLDCGDSMQRPGGWRDALTAKLNCSGLCLFALGLVMMIFF